MAKANESINFMEMVVDRLGHKKAEIAALKKEVKEMEDILKNSGETEFDGELFRATVSRYTRYTVDYKTICSRLKVSKYFTDTYRKVSNVVKVAVKAHKK